eukprot:TRINITY_DN3294_c0_g2_i3.p1 TRINITY_DN3294_c0_g2~~TRINITY_DN3294_c0_g2_i3.p1  ORF type:complete len:469 (-),score=95.12 TRINITY_DN3294_c0_g2_i3:817-2223(-)
MYLLNPNWFNIKKMKESGINISSINKKEMKDKLFEFPHGLEDPNRQFYNLSDYSPFSRSGSDDDDDGGSDSNVNVGGGDDGDSDSNVNVGGGDGVSGSLYLDYKSLISKSPKTDRSYGCFLGMLIGDAIGAPFEFSRVRYGVMEMKVGFEEHHIWRNANYNRFKLKPGQWTDDASMGLCLADSLIFYPNFNPKDLRLRFLNWWELGYCNAFAKDNGRHSVGLGGNINVSFGEFKRCRTDYTTAGDKSFSGNGSVMRNAAVPIFFCEDMSKACDIAAKQSLTTHQGEEARECSVLLTYICVNLINMTTTTTTNPQQMISDALKGFKSVLYGVNCLANSVAESENEENKKLLLVDRNWNWKDQNYKYAPTRASSQPGYIGSYAMDCMAMALHCVWTTDSFTSALLKSANMCGDSDTVSSVVGQIAGALYGASQIKTYWIDTVLQWDIHNDILLRIYKLHFNRSFPSMNPQ